MNWDVFQAEEIESPVAVEQQFVPDGTHVAKITWSGIQTKDWAKGTGNPEGKVLTVKLEVSARYRPIWESIPCHHRGKVEQLCRSARVDPPAGEWDEKVLKGQHATIDTLLALSKAGNEYVKIAAWKPGPDPLPKEIREAPARTPAAKVRAASPGISGDDIPFVWLVPFVVALIGGAA